MFELIKSRLILGLGEFVSIVLGPVLVRRESLFGHEEQFGPDELGALLDIFLSKGGPLGVDDVIGVIVLEFEDVKCH